MKWPFVLRSTHEAALEKTERALRRRLFVLRGNMKEAKRRARMNFHLSENHAAYCILDQALIRDLEEEHGTKASPVR